MINSSLLNCANKAIHRNALDYIVIAWVKYATVSPTEITQPSITVSNDIMKLMF